MYQTRRNEIDVGVEKRNPNVTIQYSKGKYNLSSFSSSRVGGEKERNKL